MHGVVVRTLAVVFLVCLVAITASGATVVHDERASVGVVAADTDDDNETIRHQNPDEYDGDGGTDATESWLADQLGERLSDSAIALDRGEYERASEYVDEEYYDRLEQYVDVAGETGGEEDGDGATAGQSYEETAEEQSQFANRTEQYYETKSEYETAREEGDRTRARELARELELLAGEISDLNESVSGGYDRLTAETDRDFDPASEATANVSATVEREQAVIREAEFVETELVLEPDGERASFLEPMTGQAEVRTADGEPVAGNGGQLVVRDRPLETTFHGNGSLEFAYRPVLEALSTESVAVEYRPDPGSEYLGSRASIPVSIESTEVRIENLETESSIGYGELVRVEGDFETDAELPVDDVPVTVTLGEHELDELSVENGSFSGTVPVPATVTDGDRTLRVGFPFEERALSSAETERTVTVRETDTEISLEAERTNDSSVLLDGRLETEGGEGIEGQEIEIRTDGLSMQTVGTDEDGNFTGTVSVGDAGADERTIVATYDGSGTNLASTEATVTMDEGAERSVPGSAAAWALSGLVVTAIGLGLARRYRNRDSGGERDTTAREPVRESAPVERSPLEERRSVVESLLESADDRLESGDPDAATRLCYAATRTICESSLETARPGTLTHWEFYRRYRQLDGEVDSLEEITQAYERATYTPRRTSVEDAERALETARRLYRREVAGEGIG
ncbi:DUF4129 domain-containing protein [Natrarchaeobius oligotrophus]|uniref:DUF4129 domain-containing protein n=1 Tax=Natrarchaeobius chitinivorans TaxID=1679083 RepID=A0A3N6MGU7_NATCH|nr:DUF4129 domain-containing protein [Natrarchaeobius chitinivorans]RQH02268.1 DUF4129 domain-containing protein [Natrarchaeobius chitinivorans]